MTAFQSCLFFWPTLYKIKLKINNVKLSSSVESLVIKILGQNDAKVENEEINIYFLVNATSVDLSNDLIGRSHILRSGPHYDQGAVINQLIIMYHLPVTTKTTSEVNVALVKSFKIKTILLFELKIFSR